MDHQQTEHATTSALSSLSTAQQDEVLSQTRLIEDSRCTISKNNGLMDSCAMIDEDGNYHVQLSRELVDLSNQSHVTVTTKPSTQTYSNEEENDAVSETQFVKAMNAFECEPPGSDSDTVDSGLESIENLSLIICSQTPTVNSDSSLSPPTIVDSYDEQDCDRNAFEFDSQPKIFPTMDCNCDGLTFSSQNDDTCSPVMLDINDRVHSPLYQENEFALPSGQSFYARRSSSLRAKKTPPNTPSCKKEVRFADAFGLDLASVRTVFNLDSPPQIPAQAMWDLPLRDELMNKDPFIDEGSINANDNVSTTALRFVQATFLQPGLTPKFHQRVLDQCVCLDNAIVENTTVQGTVCVKNVSYKKHVTIRYTVDEWNTFAEAPASYIQGSCNQLTDRFSFALSLPERIFVVGSRLQFCISYQTSDQVYWDNNYGQNYSFVCYAKLPSEAANNADSCSWTHFL